MVDTEKLDLNDSELINNSLSAQLLYGDSFESVLEKLDAALIEKYPDGMEWTYYRIIATYPTSVIVKNRNDGTMYSIPYTINSENKVELGDPEQVDTQYVVRQTAINSMKSGVPVIQLNSENNNPVYRVLVQSPNELPAPDMGLDKITYDSEAIKQALPGLVGSFVYDETQSNHNKRNNPELRGHKFAKIVNQGFCPDYGGYADWEVFDHDYIPQMDQFYDSWKRGLPVKEGPSTELTIRGAEKYGVNNAKVTEFDYGGVVWIDNPRDKSLGVCSALNSINDVLEDDKLTDEIKISKAEYERLQQLETDNATLQSEKATLETEKQDLETERNDLQTKYNEGKTLYETSQTKIEELEGMLNPLLVKQESEKAEMINSIISADSSLKQDDLEKLDFAEIEKITVINSIIQDKPEDTQPELKKQLESMTIDQIKAGITINSIIKPVESGDVTPPKGVTNGGPGSGKVTENKYFEDEELNAKYLKAEELSNKNSRTGIITSSKEAGGE